MLLYYQIEVCCNAYKNHTEPCDCRAIVEEDALYDNRLYVIFTYCTIVIKQDL